MSHRVIVTDELSKPDYRANPVDRCYYCKRELFHKLSKATDRFLYVMLTFRGTIPDDDRLRKAVQHQRAVVDAFPRSPSALAMKRMARQVDSWPDQENMSGQLEFFIERLINADADTGGVY